MIRISVVIRAFNEAKHIGRLLIGLAKQRRAPNEIIVVDSGSTDATLEIASRFPVRIISIAPEEFSFGRSLNVGCSAASGDIIAIASAHVYPLSDSWLEELVAPFAYPDVALAYGRQQAPPTAKYSEHQIYAKWFPQRSVQRQRHPFCNNANAAIRRKLWEQSPYNEDLTGLEDLDWAKRALDAGHNVAYAAEAVVIHVHEESIPQIVNRFEREALAHRRIFDDQRFTLLDAIRLAASNVVADYWHAARDRRLSENLLSIPSFRLAQFWGTYRGFNRKGPVSDVLKRRYFYPNGLARQPPTTSIPRRGNLIDYPSTRTIR